MRLDRLRLLGRLPHQLWQGKDFMRSAYAVLKIPPEGHAQLPAGLLQADKGVAARRPELAPRAGADLRFLAHSRMSLSERLLCNGISDDPGPAEGRRRLPWIRPRASLRSA